MPSTITCSTREGSLSAHRWAITRLQHGLLFRAVSMGITSLCAWNSKWQHKKEGGAGEAVADMHPPPPQTSNILISSSAILDLYFKYFNVKLSGGRYRITTIHVLSDLEGTSQAIDFSHFLSYLMLRTFYLFIKLLRKYFIFLRHYILGKVKLENRLFLPSTNFFFMHIDF